MRLYHGTADVLVPSILESGLVPISGIRRKEPVLTNVLETATDFASYRHGELQAIDVDSEPVVLEYEVPESFVKQVRFHDAMMGLPHDYWYAVRRPITREYLVRILHVPHVPIRPYVEHYYGRAVLARRPNVHVRPHRRRA